MPLQSFLVTTLPVSGTRDDDFQVFDSMLYIMDARDEITLLNSMMRPKRIRLLGSDGQEYSYLAKPKDDLRKDTRMMELAAVLNTFFQKEPESRRRMLYIRTFSGTHFYLTLVDFRSRCL